MKNDFGTTLTSPTLRKANSELTLESMSQARWYNVWLLDKFSEYLKGSILEVGGGIGNFTPLLKKHGEVWSIDIDRTYLKKRQDPHSGYGDIERGQYFFSDRKFDCIVCLNVLEHIRDDNKALSNMCNLLKKDGVLILLVPTHKKLYGSIDQSIGHYRRYDKDGLVSLLIKTGFKIDQVKRLNWIGAVGWWLANKTKSSYLKSRDIMVFNLLAPAVLFLEKFIELPFGISILVIAKKKP